MSHMSSYFSAFPSALGFILWVLIAEIPVIALLAYIIGMLRKLPGIAELEDQAALEIIKRRYASGEISKEEMDEIIEKIKSI